MRIKKGDNVQVLTGKDRGKIGKVLRSFPALGKVIVEGVNVHKKHRKTNKQTKQGGAIIELALPLDASNVAVVDPKGGKPTRVGKTFDEGTKRFVRVAKKSGTKLS